MDARQNEIDKESVEQFLINECENFTKLLKKKCGIKALVISVIPEENEKEPIVYFNGEQLDYTELACMTASRMRSNVLRRLGMQG